MHSVHPDAKCAVFATANVSVQLATSRHLIESDARIKLQQQVAARFSARRDLRTEIFSPKTVLERGEIYRRLLKAYTQFSFNISLKSFLFV